MRESRNCKIDSRASSTGQAAVLCVSASAEKALSALLQVQGFVRVKDQVVDPGTSGVSGSH